MDKFQDKPRVIDSKVYTVRTDLAVESINYSQIGKAEEQKGLSHTSRASKGYTITDIEITDSEAEQATGKPIGKYITIDIGDFKLPTGNFEEEVDVVAIEIKNLVANATKEVLVVGLGNRDITPDAIGPLAIDNIFATRHIDKALGERIGLGGLTPVAAVATGVLGQTGIETAEIVKALVNSLKPSCVIVIDALAARSVERLAATVQLSNGGIIPGSGVQNSRKALNKETLGVPVISIGVPMVVDLGTAACEMLGDDCKVGVNDNARNMMVTPREVDTAVEHSAKLVAFAINRALQGTLSLEELIALVG